MGTQNSDNATRTSTPPTQNSDHARRNSAVAPFLVTTTLSFTFPLNPANATATLYPTFAPDPSTRRLHDNASDADDELGEKPGGRVHDNASDTDNEHEEKPGGRV